MSKIVHLELHQPINGKSHFYFGSLSAMYDRFSDEELGVKCSTLFNYHLNSDNPYRGRKCTIRIGEIERKKTNRGRYMMRQTTGRKIIAINSNTL